MIECQPCNRFRLSAIYPFAQRGLRSLGLPFEPPHLASPPSGGEEYESPRYAFTRPSR